MEINFYEMSNTSIFFSMNKNRWILLCIYKNWTNIVKFKNIDQDIALSCLLVCLIFH